MLSYRRFRVGFVFTLVLLFSLLLVRNAAAGPYSALVVEVESERVLFSQNAEELRHPASLTKMMTLYLTFEALARKQISLDDRLVASRYAVSRPPSRIGLRAGETIAVEEAILALVTQSANDAATVLAESLGGSEPGFAAMMNAKARQLGMNNSVFYNASGLPNPDQVTTAWDMFRLGKALLKDFPEYYPYFSTDHFNFGGRSFHNHNHLLKSYPGADGIKTGFVNASGFNLVASAKRNGSRLIGVVFGGSTHSRRDAHMRDILDDGFDRLEGREPVQRYALMQPSDVPTLLRRPPNVKDEQDMLRYAQRAQARSPAPKNSRDANQIKQVSSSWHVRVGQFKNEKQAEQRLSQAMKAAPAALRHGKAAISRHGKTSYVAYFKGLDRNDAAQACKQLGRKRIQCSLAVASN
jgi:D-alanyl-D-alanine carboxypeptidase